MSNPAGHSVTRRLTESVMYPAHQARTASPEYRKVHHHLIDVLDEPCWVCGVRKTTINDPVANHRGATQMETHHYHVEWALANAVDPAKVLADFPEMKDATDAGLRAWLDSEGQMLVLCVAPGTPILMSDGSLKPIEQVRPDDQVVGHDGLSHQVTHAMHRKHAGELVVIDGTAVTPEHPLLTPDGWVSSGQLAVGQIVYQLGVLDTKVIGLRRVQPEILDTVVVPDSIDVMNPFATGKRSPEKLRHHPAMLELLGPPVPIPYCDPHVSLRANNPSSWTRANSFPLVKASDPAPVRAEFATMVPWMEHDAALLARSVIKCRVGNAPASSATSARAGRIGTQIFRRDKKLSAASKARVGNSQLRAVGRWRSIRDIRRVNYRGSVHDISVANCHSYVANGLVVHNCDICHRSGHYGIHSITYPAWAAQRFFRAGWDLVTGKAV